MVKNDPTAKVIGRRLKQERQRLNLTQEAFAQETGVKRVTIYQYEIGDRYPSLEFLLNARRAGANMQFLLFGTLTVFEVGDEFIDKQFASRLYRLVDRVAVDAKGRSLHIDDRLALFEELMDIATNLRAEQVDESQVESVIERFAA